MNSQTPLALVIASEPTHLIELIVELNEAGYSCRAHAHAEDVPTPLNSLSIALAILELNAENLELSDRLQRSGIPVLLTSAANQAASKELATSSSTWFRQQLSSLAA